MLVGFDPYQLTTISISKIRLVVYYFLKIVVVQKSHFCRPDHSPILSDYSKYSDNLDQEHFWIVRLFRWFWIVRLFRPFAAMYKNELSDNSDYSNYSKNLNVWCTFIFFNYSELSDNSDYSEFWEFSDNSHGPKVPLKKMGRRTYWHLKTARARAAQICQVFCLSMGQKSHFENGTKDLLKVHCTCAFGHTA